MFPFSPAQLTVTHSLTWAVPFSVLEAAFVQVLGELDKIAGMI